ncbi:MAG: Biotin--[acetyl-CoA-carboxylase] ligase [Chloroflexi bacterium]|jgi:BirA family biotin operon repressor/biotin-[acetyl-CoA-carboxylase] ligase|nr:Biotin--[acetyl-CoA-carboxylase] ligase [Chloroflexota bacterium]
MQPNHDPFEPEYFLKHAPYWRENFFYFPTIDSTNLEARKRLHGPQGPREMVLVADRQTAGRGRLNRAWEAPFASGLLCTLTVPLAPLPLDRAYLYTASLALSLLESTWQQAGVEVQLKWPNDLLRDGLKCCGILAEIEHGLGRDRNESWLALGFGLNTGLSEQDFAEAGLTGKAANVIPPGSPPLDREAFLAASLAALAVYREQLSRDPDEVRLAWSAKLITLGQPVEVRNMGGEKQLDGLAVGVDPNGGLQVRTAEGRLHTVQAGDVSVRPAGGGYA